MKIDWTPASPLFPGTEPAEETVAMPEIAELQTQEEPVDAPETNEEEPEIVVSDIADDTTEVEE